MAANAVMAQHFWSKGLISPTLQRCGSCSRVLHCARESTGFGETVGRRRSRRGVVYYAPFLPPLRAIVGGSPDSLSTKPSHDLVVLTVEHRAGVVCKSDIVEFVMAVP